MTAQEIRDELTANLVAAGVNALPYTSSDLRTPCAAVVPGEPYIRRPRGDEDPPGLFGHVRVGFDVLLLSSITEPRPTADRIDALIWAAYGALKHHRPVSVTQPGEIELSGSKYMGAVITIEKDTKEPV